MVTVCFPFVGDSVGGSHKSTLYLIKNLDRSKYRVIVVLHQRGILENFLITNEVDYKVLEPIRLPGGNRSYLNAFVGMFISFKAVSHFISKQRVDIVHTNDLRCHLAWGLPSRIRCKHLWHQRTPLTSSKSWLFIGLFSNYVVCSSLSIREKYRSWARVSTIYNPFLVCEIEREKSRRELRDLIGVKPSAFVVGLISRLEERKGVELFCELSGKLNGLCFVVAGVGPLTARLPGTVHKLGFCDPIEPVISGCDVIVAPSEKEGFGRVPVEAMLCGVPVIASDIKAHREILNVSASELFFPVGDVQSLTEKILEVRERKPSLIELNEVKEIASRRFGLKNHVVAIEAIYQLLVS